LHRLLTGFERRRLGAAGALLIWCATLVAVRVVFSHHLTYVFLGWNLFLAAVPLGASLILRRLDPRRRPVTRAVLFVLWLLFLPNAPYVITDLIHLQHDPPVPLWFDLAMLLSAAGTGLILGYLSLLDVHRLLEARFGWVGGWAAVSSAVVASGYGIYLGRFLRYNSWEVLTGPGKLLGTIAAHLLSPWRYPAAVGVTLLYGSGLLLGYVALRVLIRNEAATVAALHRPAGGARLE
jgi:uncharacterized membrane protein